MATNQTAACCCPCLVYDTEDLVRVLPPTDTWERASKDQAWTLDYCRLWGLTPPLCRGEHTVYWPGFPGPGTWHLCRLSPSPRPAPKDAIRGWHAGNETHSLDLSQGRCQDCLLGPLLSAAPDGARKSPGDVRAIVFLS